MLPAAASAKRRAATLTGVADLSDAGVRGLFEQPNHCVLTTIGQDGTLHSAIVWCSLEDGSIAVNSALGRRWPTDLERDPRVTVLVWEQDDPYHYAEVRGRATATREGADAHIDLLAKKYTGADEFGGRRPGEERIKFVIAPERVRHVKQ
jgi:PPOX class probable F420-dependent enzyme